MNNRLVDMLKKELALLVNDRDDNRRRIIDLEDKLKHSERQISRLQHFIAECNNSNDNEPKVKTPYQYPEEKLGTTGGLKQVSVKLAELICQHPEGMLIREMFKDLPLLKENGRESKNLHAYLGVLVRRQVIRVEKQYGLNRYFPVEK